MKTYQDVFFPFPTIQTDRLRLRRLEKSDRDDLFEYCRHGSSCRYSEWYPHVTRHETAEYLRWMLHRYRNGLGYTFGVEYEGKVIGTAGFSEVDNGFTSAELGYGIVETEWGKGLGTELVLGMTKFAFDCMGLDRLQARVVTENKPSLSLLAKCGFVQEGVLRRSFRKEGKVYDVAVFAMLREDYEQFCREGRKNK